MIHQFKHHYTLEEARNLLPQVRSWLDQLHEHRKQLQEGESRLRKLLSEGYDVGGPKVNGWVKAYANIKRILHEFHLREIQIKDVDRGLIDFPTMMHGREVFLCWEKDEDDIEYWHDLDAGYAGRELI